MYVILNRYAILINKLQRELMNTLANNIKKLRTERGLTQSQLALKLNVSTKTIYVWEAGTQMPSANKVKKLKEVFAVNDFVLFCGREQKATLSHAINQMRLLPEDAQNHCIEFIHSECLKIRTAAIGDTILVPEIKPDDFVEDSG